LEPFGLAPLEANACGTAAVGIAEGGVRETIIDEVNGYLVQNNKPEELGSKIALLAESRELADTLGQRARRHILENWDFGKSIEILLSHFDDTLDLAERNDSIHAI
jgi:glycosyltransferase involved in cell wall biosynthesis